MPSFTKELLERVKSVLEIDGRVQRVHVFDIASKKSAKRNHMFGRGGDYFRIRPVTHDYEVVHQGRLAAKGFAREDDTVGVRVMVCRHILGFGRQHIDRIDRAVGGAKEGIDRGPQLDESAHACSMV